MERNLTTGNVGKNILIFSLPYLLSYFLQTLYGMADLFIIGQFDGVASTTAVSIGSQVMHMLTVMLIGLAMGTTVSIARAVGGRNHKQVSENVGNTVTLFFGLSIVADGSCAASGAPDCRCNVHPCGGGRRHSCISDHLLSGDSLYYGI